MSSYQNFAIDSKKCREYANRCVEMANKASNEHALSTLLNLAKAWLKVADELDTNDMFGNRARDAEIPNPDSAVMPRPASLFTDPTTWRERAEGMRVLADEIRDAETKHRMLRIADEYDRLAKRAEERARGTPK